MGTAHPDLAVAEDLAMRVRSGEMALIDRLCSNYAERKKGLKAAIESFGRDGPNLDLNELLAASEGLEAKGAFEKALVPLQELVSICSPSSPEAKYAIARLGCIVLERHIPVDAGPIARSLGIDAHARRVRRYHVAGEGLDRLLPELEAQLFRSLLLDRRCDLLESGSESARCRLASRASLDNALGAGGSIEGPSGTFHRARCLLRSGIHELTFDDLEKGMTDLWTCHSMARDNGFVRIRALSALELGRMAEEPVLGEQLLIGSEEAFGSLGDRKGALEARSLRGSLTCAGSSLPEKRSSGIELILSAAEGYEVAEDRREGALRRVEASIWLSRSNRHKEALSQVMGALKELRRSVDEEGICLATAAGVLALIGSGDRRRAKRTMLDLVLRYPIKRHRDAYEVLKEAVSGQQWLREDPETSEMFRDVPVYEIARSAVQEIVQRAKEAYPKEFGAMLRGIEHISHIEPVMDSAGGKAAFMFSMFDRLSQRTVQGEGVVHSHPSGSAQPSRADLSMFARFPGINIIIGYPFREDSMVAYDRLGNRVDLRIV